MEKEVLEGYRLSPQQKHLWLLQQDESSSAYHARCAVMIDGKLDEAILISAIETVMGRHEILRTTFHCLAAMTIPIQVINSNGTPRIETYDLSELGAKEQEARVKALFDKAGESPFNLNEGFPLQVSLLVLSQAKHIMIVSLPALYADADGLKNLVSLIARYYSTCLQGGEPADTPLRYSVVSEWQNELLESEDTESGRAYWRAQNIPAIGALHLPLEKPDANGAGFEPNALDLTIEPDLLSRAEAVAAGQDNQLSTLLLACWQTLLWRLAGESEVIIGVACDGRSVEELDEALGLFARYLPVRMHLDGNQRFSEILEQVKGLLEDVYVWQECFTWEQSGVLVSNVKDTPFLPYCFDFMCEHSEYPAGEVTFRIGDLQVCVDRFKIKLSFAHKSGSLIMRIHYDPNLFHVEDIKRLAGQFHALLESVSENPNAAINKLRILTDDERKWLVNSLNDTKADFPSGECIHELFEAQVKLTPDAIAVVYKDDRLTYSELNAKANQLAHYLRKLGARPEAVVGICVEPSLNMLVGIIGILKAGAVYLPLDPTHPAQRLAFIMEDAQASILVSQKQLVARIPQFQVSVVCLDTDSDIMAQESNEDFTSGVRPDNLAYIIYTSGSTGTPKGVTIKHSSPINLLQGLKQAIYGVGSGTKLRASLNAPISFDASMQQIILLLDGHTLHLIPLEIRTDGKELLRYLREKSLQVFDCTPSQLKLLIDAGLLEMSDPSPELFLVAGEAVDVWTWQALAEAGGRKYYNIYGPTECTVDATAALIQQSSNIPIIGRPLANYRIYILDGELQPVPTGVAGEIHIGGSGLSRGYLNHPGLTAEKFIADPFGHEPGARLYKTGDLARRLPDGNIEFLGRIDYQVKIRGFRIELGEVEAMLEQHPSVMEAIVIATDDALNDKRLVAYLVIAQEQQTTIDEMRNFIIDKLPSYMVPSVFITLDKLPLTSNGKIDRNVLPAPSQARPELDNVFVAPRTVIEEELAQIWREILSIEQIGVHDNFFHLGGHSLSLTQLASRIRKLFQVEVPLRVLFNEPTIEAMTEAIASRHLDLEDSNEIEQMLEELKALSPGEVQALLESGIGERLAES